MEERKTVLVTGASRGIGNEISKTLARLNIKVIANYNKSKNEAIKLKEDLQKEKLDIDKLSGIKVMPYIYNMEEIMNIADLIVSRSGAMTVTEIENVGKPAIFIPFPFAAENHQEYNAKVLVNEGAAKIIHDNEINGESLNKMIEETISDKEKLKEMGNNALLKAKEFNGDRALEKWVNLIEKK